jgi:hypothetical protein
MRRVKTSGKRLMVRRKALRRSPRVRRWSKRPPLIRRKRGGARSKSVKQIGMEKDAVRSAEPSLQNPLMTSGDLSVAVILTVMNEEETLPKVLEQLELLQPNETIIVVNGSTDLSFVTARSAKHAIVLHYPSRLGHDVGRALGAKLASSDIILFLDGDFMIPAQRLLPFIQMIAAGYDVALNNISPYLGNFGNWDQVSIMKNYLNRMLGRSDLLANSMTAVPHALSRGAAAKIGFSLLAVPPLAQKTAITLGMKIGCAASIDVVSANKLRKINSGEHNLVADLIVGDHMEALASTIANTGSRLSYADVIRRREEAGGEPA